MPIEPNTFTMSIDMFTKQLQIITMNEANFIVMIRVQIVMAQVMDNERHLLTIYITRAYNFVSFQIFNFYFVSFHNVRSLKSMRKITGFMIKNRFS
jgi:hypothetical protein